MVNDANKTSKEEGQSVSEESSTLNISQNSKSRQRIGRRPKRRLILAASMAVAAVVTTLLLPTMLLLITNGEICEGYQVNVGMYYARLAPLTLVAAVLGFVIGMALPSFLDEGEKRSWRVGCGIVAIAIGGLVCAIAGCVLATYPGC